MSEILKRIIRNHFDHPVSKFIINGKIDIGILLESFDIVLINIIQSPVLLLSIKGVNFKLETEFRVFFIYSFDAIEFFIKLEELPNCYFSKFSLKYFRVLVTVGADVFEI